MCAHHDEIYKPVMSILTLARLLALRSPIQITIPICKSKLETLVDDLEMLEQAISQIVCFGDAFQELADYIKPI